MSSTKRGGQRSPADDYATPLWCVFRLMDYWGKLIGDLGPVGPTWLEPCAGEGNIIRAVRNKDPFSVPGWVEFTAVELREECEKLLGEYVPKKKRHCPRNFFDFATHTKTKFDVTITNPPYRVAQEFIEHSLAITNGLVIMLLRVNYTGSEKRHAFFKSNRPARILLLPNRPAFTEDGKTDSIEYAWFVWDTRKPNQSTIYDWLDLTDKEERCYQPEVLIES